MASFMVEASAHILEADSTSTASIVYWRQGSVLAVDNGLVRLHVKKQKQRNV